MTPKLKKLDRQRDAIDGALDLWRVKAHEEGRAALREAVDTFFAANRSVARVTAHIDNGEDAVPFLQLTFHDPNSNEECGVEDFQEPEEAEAAQTLSETLETSWKVLVNAYSTECSVIWRRDGTEEFDDATV